MTELVNFAHIYNTHQRFLVFNSGKGDKLLGLKAFKLVHCLKNHLKAYLFVKSRPCGSGRVCSKKGTFSLQIFTIDSYRKVTPVDPHVNNAEHSLSGWASLFNLPFLPFIH